MAKPVSVTLDLRGMPEVIWGLRLEMATILREAASAEADPRIGRRLVEIATAFEAGQREY